MELRAIEHAVTHSPSISGALDRLRCAAFPAPATGQPIVFSARVAQSSHRWWLRAPIGIRSRSIDTGHACFATVASSTAGRGLLSQSKARKRTRSPGWPRCRARSRSMHRVSAPTRRQCTSDVAVLIATSWLHGARAGTREGSSLQADPGPLTTRREPTPKRGCRYSARARAPPQATTLLTLSCTL